MMRKTICVHAEHDAEFYNERMYALKGVQPGRTVATVYVIDRTEPDGFLIGPAPYEAATDSVVL